jgi:hypothetical protein
LGLFRAFAKATQFVDQAKARNFGLILRLPAFAAVAFSPVILRQIKYQTKVIAVQVLILNSYGSFTQFGKCAAWAYQISYAVHVCEGAPDSSANREVHKIPGYT